LTTVQTWPSALWFYGTHLVWPASLCCFYALPFVAHLSLINFVLPLAGLVVVAAAAWLLSQRLERETRRQVAVACLWLALPLLPVLNLSVFAGGELVHDRSLYLPVLGLALLLGLGLSRLRGKARLFGHPSLQVAAGVVLTLTLGRSTLSQHD